MLHFGGEIPVVPAGADAENGVVGVRVVTLSPPKFWFAMARHSPFAPGSPGRNPG